MIDKNSIEYAETRYPHLPSPPPFTDNIIVNLLAVKFDIQECGCMLDLSCAVIVLGLVPSQRFVAVATRHVKRFQSDKQKSIPVAYLNENGEVSLFYS